ncbi:hypothetical protein CK203_082331 [Vitis vinifera]|uniref:Retrovirus-related Pol polyprotein from transposon TNT 1-94 n=1 Tax=Vitis vinifera TaxID=29760 RepID=A0A438EQX6_VITVI|nr:hypothetical protein CK203_082331 [Vitis vinifera]
MDIDYAIRKDEPHKITDTSTPNEILLHERWEKSNRLNVMYIKTKISAGIRGSIEQHKNVRELLKAIDEQFVTSDKVLANTLIMKFTSLKLIDIRGVREHIMEMRDIVAQLKKLKIEMSESFLGMQNLRKPVTSEQFILSGNKMGSHVEAIRTYDFSRYMYLYILHNKNEVLEAFKVFKAEVEKQCGKEIKIVRSDRDGEYYGRYLEDGQSLGPFAKFFKSMGLLPNTPCLGCSSEVRIYNPQEKKLDPRTISGGSNQFGNIVYDIDHTESQPSTSSDRLFIVHNTPRVQSGVERTIVEVPQAVDNILVDQVDQELPDTFEQQVEPHTSLEDIGATLRRSTRIKRSTIPNDYVVYLQKCDYNIRAENDPESFSQAMSCKESKLWYNAMKDEMSSMK